MWLIRTLADIYNTRSPKLLPYNHATRNWNLAYHLQSIFFFSYIPINALRTAGLVYPKLYLVPVNGYQAAPFVIPFGKDGVLALHARPRFMVGWFCAYVNAKCLKTSSSGVNDGDDPYPWNTEKPFKMYNLRVDGTIFWIEQEPHNRSRTRISVSVLLSMFQ